MATCLDCEKKVDLRSKRCNSCENKRRWNNKVIRKRFILGLSKSHMGQIPVNLQDLIKFTKSKKGREMTRQRSLGNTYNKGKGWPEGRKKKMSEDFKGRTFNTGRTHFKKGDGRLMGESNISWKGGVSFESYGIKFNNKLKEEIRKRDNYKCQECGYSQSQLKYSLHVHHIDYNKKNNELENLISLCMSCHAQTGFDRDDWTEYFMTKRLEVI